MNMAGFQKLLPPDYKRIDDENGWRKYFLGTEHTIALIYVKRITKDSFLTSFRVQEGLAHVRVHSFYGGVVDYCDDDSFRFFISKNLIKDSLAYYLELTAQIDDAFWAVRGHFFTPSTCVDDRRDVVKFRFYRRFTKRIFLDNPMDPKHKDGFPVEPHEEERYDIFFPDHPLTHCRRLANVIGFWPMYTTKRRQGKNSANQS